MTESIAGPLLSGEIVCAAERCNTRMIPAPDGRHIENLRDAKWMCDQCKRYGPGVRPW